MIAVDVMGGDYAPQEAILGALAAAEQKIPLILFGSKDEIISLLMRYNQHWQSLPIEVVHCSEAIGMDEDPFKGVLRKKDSSIVRAMQAVASGRAQAFVSAGNSGAVVLAASTIVGRIPGVIRPAIGGFLPSTTDSFLCLDLGANPDCTSENLVQFAYMGHVYARIIKRIACPKIAILSNGHEPYKGSEVVRQVFDRLQNSDLNFIGNIESNDIFSGSVDVVVTDGFTGNILLKGIGGITKVIVHWIKDGASQSFLSKVALFFARPLLSHLKNKIEDSRIGGALLLGVKSPVIVAHGSSKGNAIASAIKVAHETIEQGVIPLFTATLQSIFEKHTTRLDATSNVHGKYRENNSISL